MLHYDSKGPDVVALQQALQAHGFSPGNVDGDFGPGTEAALMAFQKAAGLDADGLYGPATATALNGAPLATAPLPLPPTAAQTGRTMTPAVLDPADPFRNVRTVSRMLPAAPLSNIQRYLPEIIKALDARKIGDPTMFLMANATIAAETGAYKPIDEGQSRYNTSPHGHPFDLYDNRRDLGNNGYPDGSNARGRGFVQLTGMANYRAADAALGLGGLLLREGWRANDPDIAARILAWFLGRNEAAIRQALQDLDYAKARKIVNGGAHGLDEFTLAFRRGLPLAARLA